MQFVATFSRMMSGSMNNAAAYSIEEINSSDTDAMMGPVLKQMEECTMFGEEGEIPFLISDNCKRFFALLWKVVVMSLHKNLPSSESALTSDGRLAAIKASYPDDLCKYIADDIEKAMAEGPPSFQKRHIELLIGSDVSESEYLLLGAVLDYFIMEFVDMAGAEYDRGHYFPGKNAAKTLRELYEAMTRLAPELAAWTEGKGVLYPWMVWLFMERDDTMKAFFGAAGVCGAPPDGDNNDDGDVGGDDDDESEGDRLSKEVVAMQSSDAQFIDQMKQVLAVFPFQVSLPNYNNVYYNNNVYYIILYYIEENPYYMYVLILNDFNYHRVYLKKKMKIVINASSTQTTLWVNARLKRVILTTRMEK